MYSQTSRTKDIPNAADKIYGHDELNNMRMLMLVHIKCMMTGIKSWHGKSISMGNTVNIVTNKEI
jgi:hypothetical protein